MASPQTGLVSVTFRKESPERLIEWVREAGLDGIEWGGDVHVPSGDLETANRIGLATRQAGLAVLAYGSYYRCEPTADPSTDFQPVLDTALHLGAPLIRVWPGTLGSADLTPDGRRNLVQHSRIIASMAAEKGMVVASEYHGGTVTDTPESALRFLQEVGHRNYRTLWQPHNGMPFTEALASLQAILPYLANVHVFHWWPSAGERHPLVAGEERWREYLAKIRSLAGEHACLLEFVKGDDAAQFFEDARTLRSWLNPETA